VTDIDPLQLAVLAHRVGLFPPLWVAIFIGGSFGAIQALRLLRELMYMSPWAVVTWDCPATPPTMPPPSGQSEEEEPYGKPET